jgi:O-antigen ligase/tetratricopeptide (TPR) repeat protein
MHLRRPLARFSYVLPILLLLLVAVTWDAPNPSLRYAGYLTFAGAFLALSLLTPQPAERVRIPKVGLWILCLVLFQAALLPFAAVPAYGVKGVLAALALSLTFLLFGSSLTESVKPRHIENALIMFALVFSLLELALLALRAVQWWGISGSIISEPPVGSRGTGLLLQHPVVMAAFINLSLPLIVSRVLQARSRRHVIGWSALILVLLLELYNTTSRAAWAAGAAGIALTGALILWPRWRERFTHGRVSREAILRPKTILLAFTAVALVLAAGYALVRKTIAVGSVPATSARAEVWRVGWAMFRGSPLLGQGPGSYAPFHAALGQRPPGEIKSHAHNLLLQLGAESGVLAVGLALWVIGSLAIAFYRAWRHELGSLQSRAALAGYAGAFAAAGLHHLVDVPLDVPLYAAGLLLLLAAASRWWLPSDTLGMSTTNTRLLLTVSALALGAGVWFASRGEGAYWAGLQAERSGDLPGVQELLCDAADESVENPLYAFQCGLAGEQQAAHGDEGASLIRAGEYLRRGLAIDPYWSVNRANLAGAIWSQGDETAAVQEMQLAVNAAPRSALFWLDLGYMQETLGDRAAALESYRHALLGNAWMADSLFFSSTDLRMLAVEEARAGWQASEVAFPFWLWSDLHAGDLPQVARQLGDLIAREPRNVDARATIALLQLRAGRTQDAARILQVAEFLDPNNARLSYVAGKLAYSASDEDLAVQKWLQCIDRLRHITLSDSYYYEAFRTYDLPDDLSPTLPRANLSVDMADDFELLADILDRRGDANRAEEVRAWIKAQAFPLEPD